MHHGPEFTVVVLVGLALAFGALMRLISAWTKFPYTIGMLLIGIGLGVLVGQLGGGTEPVLPATEHAAHGADASLAAGLLRILGHGSHISADLIIFVFVPALVFESSYAIDFHVFRNNVGAVVLLAGPALVLATIATAAAMVGITLPFWHWGWPVALVFGALISATDPVAVVAILRELGVSKRLGVLIEGESMLNDGTAIVVFTVLLGMLGGSGHFSVGGALVSFLYVVIGGVAVGLVLAIVLSKWIEALFNDPLSEITLTIVMAYAAMVVAEGIFHVSGVMAVVTAGLWMGAVGRTQVSPEVSHFLHRFWGTLGYIANTLIFFLVGLVIATQLDRAQPVDFLVVGLSYLAVMAIRLALVYAFQPLATRCSDGVDSKDSAVMAWGGLRGAVSLALALLVAQRPELDPELRRQILFVTAGVVFLTILVNGTTMSPLLGWLGLSRPPLSEELGRLAARAQALGQVQSELTELSRSRDLRAVSWGDVRERITARLAKVKGEMESVREALARASETEREAAAWRRVISLERQALWHAFAQGTLLGNTVQQLTEELDRQLDRLNRADLTVPETRMPAAGPGSWLAFLTGGRQASFEHMALVYDLSRAESLGADHVLKALDGLTDIESEVRDRIRETYQRFLAKGKERIEDMRTNLPELATAIETRLAARIELNLERECFEELGETGVLDEEAVHAELHDVEHRMQQLRRGVARVAIPETAELVASTPLFSSLDPAALKQLAELTDETVVPPNQYLFRAGEKGDSLYVIARGCVHVLVELEGREHLVDVLGGGDLIGEMALLTGAPRTASAKTATSVTLGKVRRESFDKLMSLRPELRHDIFHEFAKRRFDNALRGMPEFSRLDRDAKRLWFDSADTSELGSGEELAVQSRHAFVFVIVGSIELGGTVGEAPSLVPTDGHAMLRANTAARVALLADPSVVLHQSRRAGGAA